jgi:hypothetical protein
MEIYYFQSILSITLSGSNLRTNDPIIAPTDGQTGHDLMDTSPQNG